MTNEDLKLVATVVLSTIPSGITVAALIKWNKQLHEVLEAIATSKRVGLLVEGDKTKHGDPKLRDGLLGRVESLEEDKTHEAEADRKRVSTIDKVWRRVRAILRGLGVPSDISDDLRVEREVEKRIKGARYQVDRLGAGLALTDRDPTGPHPVVRLTEQHDDRHSPIERVPRPTERRDSRHHDDRREPSEPPSGDDE